MFQLRYIKDYITRQSMLVLTAFSLLFLFIIGATLFIKAYPIIDQKSIWSLISTSTWQPFKGNFGFFSFIFSTLFVTGIAIAIALPLSLLSGIYLSEYASKKVRNFFFPVIDLLSGIPPVIYGVWGTLTVVPFISEKLAPHFVDFSTGYSVLAGGVVLSIMIIPLIISLLVELLRGIPQEMREAVWSLGATKWETIKKVLIVRSIPGIIAIVVLAISRAFGETIAVLMVCGNFTNVPSSIFDSCYPIPALIANNYGEMLSIPGYEAALMFAALLLFVIIVVFNALSRLILHQIHKRYHL